VNEIYCASVCDHVTRTLDIENIVFIAITVHNKWLIH